ncbi:MAG: CBS domain-containing protein [Spirochaetales bacterium]|nr:CBS domain-containing protein [Spirochaetales bacterium]
MKLHDLLNEAWILLDRPIASKEEGISLLVKTFLAQKPFRRTSKDLESLLSDREALGGTTFPTGIAVPHARLEELDDVIILILRPSQPLPDPVAPIRLITLMLVSQGKPGRYLNALAGFLKLSQKSEVFEALLAAPNAGEFLNILTGYDYSLEKITTVEEILPAESPSISPDATIHDLIDLFYKFNASYAPAVDEDGHVVGEISLADILQAAFPGDTSSWGNLKFLRSFEPLERLAEQEESIHVRDLMKPVTFACSPTTPVGEVTFEFLQKQRRHCPVVRGRQLVGVLSIMDILNKVIRG